MENEALLSGKYLPIILIGGVEASADQRRGFWRSLNVDRAVISSAASLT